MHSGALEEPRCNMFALLAFVKEAQSSSEHTSATSCRELYRILRLVLMFV